MASSASWLFRTRRLNPFNFGKPAQHLRDENLTLALRNHFSASPLDPNFSLWLDMFRWVAAFCVLLDHVNTILFVKILTLPRADRSIEQYVLAFFAGFGRPAVLVFFVLSGFLVGGTSLRKYISRENLNSIEYFSSRLSRLWIVLIPGLLLTTVANYIGGIRFGGAAAGNLFPWRAVRRECGPCTGTTCSATSSFSRRSLADHYGGEWRAMVALQRVLVLR